MVGYRSKFKDVAKDGKKYLRSDKLWKEALPSVSPVTLVIKSVDESRASTVSANPDSELFIPILAGFKYSFEIFLNIDKLSYFGDFQYYLYNTSILCNYMIHSPGSPADGQVSASNMINICPISNLSNNGIFLVGEVSASFDTIFKFNWAQNVSSTTPTTLKAGSWMKITKLI